MKPDFTLFAASASSLAFLQVFLDFHPAGRLPFQYPNPAERHEQNEEDSRACNEQIPDERAVVRFSPQVDPFRVDGQPFFLGYGGQGLVQDGDQLGPVLSYGEMEGELLFRLEGHELEVGDPVDLMRKWVVARFPTKAVSVPLATEVRAVSTES